MITGRTVRREREEDDGSVLAPGDLERSRMQEWIRQSFVSHRLKVKTNESLRRYIALLLLNYIYFLACSFLFLFTYINAIYCILKSNRFVFLIVLLL